MPVDLKPFAHQLKSLKHNDKTDIVFDCSDPGCVSADTEFLTPLGWKRIDAYVPGDQVAQFHPDEREIEFVTPLAYIKKPCAEMIHIAPARGTSQRLSPEHRVLYYEEDGQYDVCSAAEFMRDLHEVGPNHLKRKFSCTFSVRGTNGMQATDEILRLMVAVIADGHFGRKSARCVVRLKKERKIERLHRLLAQAGVQYSSRACASVEGFHVFTFTAPWREKEFGPTWWQATQAQLLVIADELPHWDSNIARRGDATSVRFSTTIEASADFAQYAFAAAKMPASLTYSVRPNRLLLEFSVHAQTEDKFVGPGRKESVFLAPNPEGYKYCFEVPSSFLLLRHNGYIFATGNTGKTAVRIWALMARIKKRKVRKALVVAPKSLLRAVWKNDIKKFAPHLRVVIATAGEHEAAYKVPADVYVTNTDAVKWLAKQPKKFFAEFDELIVDECFPAGTPVDTPTGPRAIETIQIGDIVCTTAGNLPVTNTFVSQSTILVRVMLADGTTFDCTENHPIATSEGWRNAGNLRGMSVVRLDVCGEPQSRSAVLLPVVQQEGDVAEQAANRARSTGCKDRCIDEGQDTLEQGPTLQRADEVSPQRSSSQEWASAQDPWGQRQDSSLRANGGRNAPAYLDRSVCYCDEAASRDGLPDLLQSGLCESSTQEGLGNRRQFTHIAQALGCQEDRVLGLTRVVSVTRIESGSPRRVFNLQVDGPHDYSVKGTLVHNCTSFKHHTSQRSKAMAKIAGYFKYRSCLTGTPNSNSITDVWHQVKILDGGKRLGTSFYAFRQVVCDVEQVGRSQHALRWTDKEGAEEIVFSMLQDIVIRHKLEDCTDIPANHQYTVDFEMGPRQKQAYMQMEERAIMEIYGSPKEIAHAKMIGEKIKPKAHVTAINAAAVATKLLQVSSGAVYESPGKYHVIDTERYSFVLDLVEQRQHSVVFFLWDHQRNLLTEEAEKRGLTYAVIDGSVKESERYDIARGYQAGAFRVIFLHPKSAAHGLTLTRGTAAIWASPTVDAEFFNQGSRRVYRLTQTKKTETITVIAKGTREERVYNEILAPKQKRMANLLDLFTEAA